MVNLVRRMMVDVPTTSHAAEPDAATSELSELSRRFKSVFDTDPDLGGLSDPARRVLSVAAALFCRSGSSAVSVRDLTSACGLSPGALYNHFSSRDELLFALVNNGHVRTERLLAAGPSVSDAGVDPRDALRHFVVTYTGVHLRFPEHAQLVHREYVHLAAAHRRQIIVRRRRMRERLVEILVRGAELGAFRLLGGPDAAVGSAMMILDMCGRTSEWFNPAQSAPDLADRYAEAALRLVGAQ